MPIARSPVVPTRISGGVPGGCSSAHVAQRHEAAGGVDGLVVQQRARGAHDLLEHHEPVGRARADLAHPRLDAVAEGDLHAAGVQQRERGDLHRRDRRVAHGRGQQPGADGHALAERQRGRGRGQAAVQEAVLGEPQLVEAGGLDRPHGPGQLRHGLLRPHQHAESRSHPAARYLARPCSAPRSPPPSPHSRSPRRRPPTGAATAPPTCSPCTPTAGCCSTAAPAQAPSRRAAGRGSAPAGASSTRC